MFISNMRLVEVVSGSFLAIEFSIYPPPPPKKRLLEVFAIQSNPNSTTLDNMAP